MVKLVITIGGRLKMWVLEWTVKEGTHRITVLKVSKFW